MHAFCYKKHLNKHKNIPEQQILFWDVFIFNALYLVVHIAAGTIGSFNRFRKYSIFCP